MSDDELTRWLHWAREIHALGQSGLAFCGNEFDRQRYERLVELAAEIVQDHTGLPKAVVMQGFSAEVGYAAAKIDVRGAVVRDGRILLVQERSDGRWCMPGGWADITDKPSAMVAREVWEESGFEVVTRKVIGVFDANRKEPLDFYHAYKIVFLCEITGGQATPSLETTAVDFFDFDELPPLSAFRTDARHLAEVRAHLADPARAAAFD